MAAVEATRARLLAVGQQRTMAAVPPREELPQVVARQHVLRAHPVVAITISISTTIIVVIIITIIEPIITNAVISITITIITITITITTNTVIVIHHHHCHAQNSGSGNVRRLRRHDDARKLEHAAEAKVEARN
jgi:hypothetical protein